MAEPAYAVPNVDAAEEADAVPEASGKAIYAAPEPEAMAASAD